MSKNIEFKNGGSAEIGNRVRLITKTRDGDIVRTGVLLAVNTEITTGNGRIVFDDMIGHLPAVTISELELIKPGGAVGSEQLRNEQGLRTDGPTLAEYVTAGFAANDYPPKGYTDKRTDAELAEALRAKAGDKFGAQQ